MNLTINKHYELTFDSTENQDFSGLNGIYFVARTLVYKDIVLEGIDMVEFLYGRVDKNEADWERDVVNYINDVFYQLISTADESVVWVPVSLLVGFPNAEVKEYKKVMLTTDLGVFDDPNITHPLKDIVYNQIKFATDKNAVIAAITPTLEAGYDAEEVATAIVDAFQTPAVLNAVEASVATEIPSLEDALETALLAAIGTMSGGDSASALDVITTSIKDTVMRKLGSRVMVVDGEEITYNAVEPYTNVTVYGKIWLTKQRYDDITAKRSEVQDSTSDVVINHHKLILEQEGTIHSLRSRVAALEQHIIDIQEADALAASGG